jgi:hypothetical protein
MDQKQLQSLSKEQIPEAAKTLSVSDINFIVASLEEKNEDARYRLFLLLQAKSRESNAVYTHWATLEKKLASENSYQRSLGLMLISENVRWDREGKFGKTIEAYLNRCMDQRFVTSRQAIQGLANVVSATSVYNGKIKQRLTQLSFAKYKESQRSLLKRDVAAILALIG